MEYEELGPCDSLLFEPLFEEGEFVNAAWKYPLGLVVDFAKFYEMATQENLSEKRLRSIRSLLQRKQEFACEGKLELQWKVLRAIYTGNFDVLEGPLPRIRTHYASNFSPFF